MQDLRDKLQQSLGSAYVIERELGGGGMSRVFLAEETRFRRRVVIKVLSPELAAGLSAERFEREIALAARLQEPHIVPVHAAGATGDGLPWYSMPYVDGESLRHRLAAGPMPATEAVAILRDVVKALAYAHEQGLVHRDIKPENILLSGGTAVVTDFGIAKAVSASRTQAQGATLTGVGISLGTPAYMAPEQAAGEETDHRTDLYAWGIVAYELLAGAHPFAGKTTSQLIAAQIVETPPALSSVRPELPSKLCDIVMQVLEKDPARRPASARTLVDALDGVVTTGERTPPSHASPRARRIMLVAGLILLPLAAALVWRARHPTPADPSSSTSTVISTLAVLPFTNTNGDAKDEYFSDGMTDELAHALSRLPGIRVAGRSSSYAFKGKTVGPKEVGRTLDVAGVIEGSVRRSGDRVRVIASLTSTADGKVLSSATYESSSSDVFAVQDSLTEAIVASLTPALRGEHSVNVAASSRGTADAGAYDLYLQGRYLWDRRGTENLRRAIALFQRAVARDPSFARAHAAMALAYDVLTSYAGTPVDSVARLVEDAAGRALTLDSTLAEAHAALGYLRANQLRLSEADAEYRAALRLAPEDATVHHWRGRMILLMGRPAEALEEFRHASRLDPLSATVSNSVAGAYRSMRRFPESVAASQRTLKLDSTFAFGRSNLAMGLVFAGHPDSAVRVMEPTAWRIDARPLDAGVAIFAYAAAGRWRDAERLRASRQAGRRGTMSDLEIAITAITFGDDATALAAIERGASAGGEIIGRGYYPNCDPISAPLTTQPRFTGLMARYGLHVCAVTEPWPIKSRPA